MGILLCAQVANTALWLRELRAAMPDEDVWLWPDVPDSARVDIALVAKPPPGIVAQFPGLRLIASLWAGVDGLLADPGWPRHIPLTRLIDPQLTAAMVESVVLHVLSAHRLAPRYRRQQSRSEWIQHAQPSAAGRTVVILGLGELGRACADALAPFGFKLVGWSRTPRSHPAAETLSGADGLQRALSRADILVCLLPNTAGTKRLLDATTLAWLPRGSSVINVGRGAAIDDDALLSALDSGHVEAAILDVFDTEPLPPAHRYWRHERVWVYPHVAAETDPRTAARIVADTVRRFRGGEALPERVDPDRGY